MLDTQFLDTLLNKYCPESVNAYIADSNARILVCSQTERIGSTGSTARYILITRRAATIQSSNSLSASQSNLHYGSPVLDDGTVEYVVVAYGPPEQIEKTGDRIQVALQTALEYRDYEDKKKTSPKEELEEIASVLLSEKPDKNKLLTLMYRNELEPDLVRCVINIQMKYHRNTYFNINLNLGYEAAIEKLRYEVSRKLKRSRYLNSQDLVYIPDRNTILIIKSFLHVEDTSRLYLALEEICKDFMHILGSYPSLSYSIAYGNFYRGIEDLHQSWTEAYEMLELGKTSETSKFYNLDNLFFEYVSKRIGIQIENKFILPAIQKLTDKNGSLLLNLIYNAELFADHCMSLSNASNAAGIHRNTINARLQRFIELTGLNPAESFRDAFLSKMIAVYVRRREH